MERELVSVVIPVYKVEAYLEKCVQSVLAQTYEQLQIILVDDGSPDGCPALCDALAAQDGRITVIHQENAGLSAARNAGLDAARGAYIGFVDSDDYIAREMYEKLYAALRKADAGMALCGYTCVDEDGRPVRTPPPMPEEVLTPEQAYWRMTNAAGAWRYVTAVNRLYKRELFDGVRFPVGKLYEDEFAAPLLYERSRRAVVIPEALYCYVQRSGSIMDGPVTVRRLDAVQAFAERYDFFRARGLDDLAQAALRRAYVLLWEVVTQVDVWREREAVGPWVRRIMAAQLRHLSPSAAMLAARYALQLVRGMASARRKGGER